MSDTNAQHLAIADDQVGPGGKITLTPPQQRYLRQVLRLRAGNIFIALLERPLAQPMAVGWAARPPDPASHWWLAQLDELPEVAWLREPRPEPAELPCRVILVAALPKGAGFEEVVRQAVELGVTEIYPVLSERTLLRPGAGRVDRWRRIGREAAEQAERAIVPSLADPQPLADLLAHLPTTDTPAYWCDPRRGAPALGDRLAQLATRSGPIALATGPEGGWSEAETAAAIAAGWATVSLGGRILRAVTAPVVAIALVAAWAEGTATANSSSATGLD